MAQYIGFSTQFTCPAIAYTEKTISQEETRGSGIGDAGTINNTIAAGSSNSTYSVTKGARPRSTDSRPGIAGAPGTILQPLVPGKKFRLVDEQLVIADILNALNIREGEKVGNPGYGCRIWNMVFEPNDLESRKLLETEVRRVIGLDSRVILNNVITYYAQNGILVEVEMAISPFNNVTTSRIGFDIEDGRATFVSLT